MWYHNIYPISEGISYANFSKPIAQGVLGTFGFQTIKIKNRMIKSCDLVKMAASGSIFAGRPRTGSNLPKQLDADGNEAEVISYNEHISDCPILESSLMCLLCKNTEKCMLSVELILD